MMKPLEVLYATCCLLSCAACSVKEDRGVCPCRLMLDFSENDTVSVRSAELLLSASGGFSVADTLQCAEFAEEYQVMVPRGNVNVLAWYGGGECEVGESGLRIPYGEDCPEVYMCFFNVQVQGEVFRRTVRMKKNHCKATLYVQSEEDFPYRLVVRGDVGGYDHDGAPSEGEFMCELVLSDDMVGWVSLPRQRNDSLCLEVWEGDEVLKIFTLGRYISAVGYDWSAEDLEDITLSLDYAHNIIGISIGEWDEEHHFNVSI
jgi:hypothetical protein